jgi:hypothetical protein
MTSVHAVEIANRHDSAGKRTTVDTMRAAARNMEMFCGHLGPAHRNAMQLQEMVVKNVHIFSSMNHLGRGYG